VLWIGYLQWHFRTRGQIMPPQPVLKDFHNIECRDAVLAYDRVEYVTDERGVPVTRWDGRTMKKHPVTGEDVPDETARMAVEKYINPRKAEWPEADFVIGNPPFLGKGKIRDALGDGYVEALRQTWKEVPDSTDFVLYWWHHAADLARASRLRRFGLITTNSLRQKFNRRVLEHHIRAVPPISLVFAIADHPWVDSTDGAAVRIAMTVGECGDRIGRLWVVTEEQATSDEAPLVSFATKSGRIFADITIGANVVGANTLRANNDVAHTGFILGGRGFVLQNAEAKELLQSGGVVRDLVFPLRNGEDILNKCRQAWVIDAFGLSETALRERAPRIYQQLRDRVYPERQQNRDPRLQKNWWLFRRSNEQVRASISGLNRFIVTAETSKHRVFTFLDSGTRPEHRLVVWGLNDAYFLGVLSSAAHLTWALRAGGTLEDRPVYNKSCCFEPFPFPDGNPEHEARIRDFAEQLDAHRKRQQAQHADLTLTGMYNVLEKLKTGEALNAKEKVIHEQGLVAVLKTLHDELDRAVLDAYGWTDLVPLLEAVNGNRPPPRPAAAPAADGTKTMSRENCKRVLDNALLERLVALNVERAAEEKRGMIRWLRPEFQIPASGRSQEPKPEQIEIDTGEEVAVSTKPGARRPWPAALPEQVKAVAEVLNSAHAPLADEAIAACFTGRGPWKKRLPQIIDTLVAVGRVRRRNDGRAVIA
jgi:hypothetical protein